MAERVAVTWGDHVSYTARIRDLEARLEAAEERVKKLEEENTDLKRWRPKAADQGRAE